jgi:hypothetical protein
MCRAVRVADGAQHLGGHVRVAGDRTVRFDAVSDEHVVDVRQ